MLIAVTSSDEANLLACMVAQAESSVSVKIARLRTHEVEHWRRVAQQVGLRLDLIIHPETQVAEHVMRVVGLPGVSDIFDFAGGAVKLFGMNVERESWFNGKTLEELDAAGPPKDLPQILLRRFSPFITRQMTWPMSIRSPPLPPLKSVG